MLEIDDDFHHVSPDVTPDFMLPAVDQRMGDIIVVDEAETLEPSPTPT